MCAREKRECKLRRVTFPPRDAAAPPGWLLWADDAHWDAGREDWYDRVDALINIDSYLRVIFEVGKKLEDVDVEVAAIRADSAPREGGFATVEAAEAWEKRVQQWAKNTRDALCSDSVEAPGLHEGRRWLLYQSPSLEISDGHITCFLCRKCRTNLAFSDSDGRPAPRLPAEARANGLWRGPDPPELSSLSHTEAKVLNLARIYVSVKRVFLNSSSYARTSASEAPLYHHRNVVAFPQSVDKTLTSLGTPPQVLADQVVVQFVGENRDALRQHPELSVSTRKLREAFFWASQNSWPFMEATKHHELWDQKGTLAPALEDLLQAYETSVGASGAGTPKELIERAVRVAPERATVHRAGPADCTAREDGTEPDDTAAGAGDNGEDGNCAAAIHGGTDDISPLQLWNIIMQKYKVQQECEEALARLRSQKPAGDLGGSDYQALVAKSLEASASAVYAWARLRHRESMSADGTFVWGPRSPMPRQLPGSRCRTYEGVLKSKLGIICHGVLATVVLSTTCLERWYIRDEWRSPLRA